MNLYDGHCLVSEILKERRSMKLPDLALMAIQNGYSFAILTQGYFIGPAKRGPTGRRVPFDSKDWNSRISNNEWLYLDPSYVPGLITQDVIEAGFFLSSPDGVVDTWAERRNGQKIKITEDLLWLPSDQAEMMVNVTPKRPISKRTSTVDAVSELREAAVKLCLKKLGQGIEKKYIHVQNIASDLYREGKFASGEQFSNRWHSPESIRGHLKGRNSPKSDPRYKATKPAKNAPFNTR